MGNTGSREENPKDISARELKVGSRYRYYGRYGKLEKCRTLKVKRSSPSGKSYRLGWDMGWKDRKQFKWGGLAAADKDAKMFRECSACVTRRKKRSTK
jgi:hypothetical protein